MQTIVLATQKGGSGKSTLAIGLALAAIQAGHNVRLIETDSQGTLSNWQSRRIFAEPMVEPVYTAGEIEPRLQTLRKLSRLPRLRRVVARERQRQPDNNRFDVALADQRRELPDAGPAAGAQHRLDRRHDGPGRIADRDAAARAAVVQREHAH